jgi:hypothetical protein
MPFKKAFNIAEMLVFRPLGQNLYQIVLGRKNHFNIQTEGFQKKCPQRLDLQRLQGISCQINRPTGSGEDLLRLG